jgi:hypothetical protein
MPKKPMSREFKRRLMRRAAMFFVALVVVLLLLVSLLNGKQFAVAALIVIPIASLSFNFLMRRAYAAEMAGKR